MSTQPPHEAARISGPHKSQSTRRRDLRRAAARLARSLEQAADERQESWSEGTDEFMSMRHADNLDGLHQAKRSMRRDVYRAAPGLEGTTVYRHGPKVGG